MTPGPQISTHVMQTATVQNQALERCKMQISPWTRRAIGAPPQTTFGFGCRCGDFVRDFGERGVAAPVFRSRQRWTFLYRPIREASKLMIPRTSEADRGRLLHPQRLEPREAPLLRRTIEQGVRPVRAHHTSVTVVA